MPTVVRQVTVGLVVAWLALVAGLGWWLSQRTTNAWLDSLATSAEYETQTTVRVMDRLFTEMFSVVNMVARQGQVIRLADSYRTDVPGAPELTREPRAAQFTRDPLVRKVSDFMNALSSDLRYAHIALIVNRQGRVTTASSAPFLLRNVAAFLPPGTVSAFG